MRHCFLLYFDVIQHLRRARLRSFFAVCNFGNSQGRKLIDGWQKHPWGVFYEKGGYKNVANFSEKRLC